MLDALRACGLKVTPQRLAILNQLVGDPTHPTATELFGRLREELPSMSFATVYNTLAALTKQGLCAARQLESGPVRFDPNVAPHDHAVCDACGLVIDVMTEGLAAASAATNLKPVQGFSVRSVERIYRGRCVQCAAPNEPQADAEKETGD